MAGTYLFWLHLRTQKYLWKNLYINTKSQGKIFDNSDHTGKIPCSEDFIQQSSETINCWSVNGVGNGHAERVGEMFKAEESEDICD